MALKKWVLLAGFLFSVTACGGGGGELDQSGCTGDCASPSVFLSTTDVERVVRQAVHEAQTRNAPATVAVVDRVGNVLAVFRMTGAAPTATVSSSRGVTGGLEGAVVPAELAAIAKAMTGAYLSSEGNAFSTRTASQIVQEHFNPGEANAPGGPLFGVQFSSLTCSDVVNVNAGVVAGPKGSPLGLSADPGGLPLYNAEKKLVGAIGVSGDTSCADHNIAWRTRRRLQLDWVPAGVGANGDDNINYAGLVSEPSVQSDFSHPICKIGGADNVSAISAGLPAVRK